MPHPRLTKEQFQARVAQVLAEEALLPERWMYFSFADEDGWRGGIFLLTHGIAHAQVYMSLRHINPGGEMLGLEVPEGGIVPAPEFCGRLLDQREMELATGQLVRFHDGSEVERVDPIH